MSIDRGLNIRKYWFRNFWRIENLRDDGREGVERNVASFERWKRFERIVEICCQFLKVIFWRFYFLCLLALFQVLEYSWRFFTFLQLLFLRGDFHVIFIFVLLLRRRLLTYCHPGNVFELGSEGRRKILLDSDGFRHLWELSIKGLDHGWDVELKRLQFLKLSLFSL